MSRNLVIIPTYNEKGNIERILQAIMDLNEGFDVLVVDDASPDDTAGLVTAFAAKNEGVHLLERSGKLGLGTAYIAGFKWGLERDYDFIFEMDADFSHSPSALPILLKACQEEGVGMSIGSRYTSGGKVENWPLSRILMSYFASVYVRMVLWLSVSDTTAGFVCYRSSVLREINLDQIEFIGYAFQIEMKYAVHLLGYKLKEVPITFKDRAVGVSKMSTAIFNEAFVGVWKMRRKGMHKAPYRNSVY